MQMEKRESKNGIIQLASNVKAAYNTVDRGLFEDVGPDDLDHMILVVNYCSTTIGRKSDDIQIYIVPAYHEVTKDVILYTLYVALPMKTVLEDEHLFYIRSISPRRINRSILYEHDTKANLMRLQICINPMKYMPEVEEMSIVNIHLKQSRTVHYHTEKDDDKRGSTKRPRIDAGLNK
jgi:hypothetical protein